MAHPSINSSAMEPGLCPSRHKLSASYVHLLHFSFFKGEPGLLVSKITNLAPFSGYAQNEEQTERKRLHNVLKKGDLYFNTGDLMRIDKDNFIYFQDRVGDTFRY